MRTRCPVHGIPDCSPLLNGCSWNPDQEPIDLRPVDEPERAEAERELAGLLQQAKDDQVKMDEERADEEGRCP